MTADEGRGWDGVFWDIGGVILDLDSVSGAHRQFVATLVDRHDVDASVDEALETWRGTVGQHFRDRDGTEFRAARDGYAKGVTAVVGESVPAAEWRPAFDEALGDAIEPVPGATAAIRELAERDFHVGVISDVDADEGRRILDAFDVREAFDSITTSEAVGRTKPDPAMFEQAIETAGVDPERSLMIGDRYEHDIAGAASVGLQTVAFGADDGAAMDYRVDSPRDVLDIVDADGMR